MHYLRYMGEFLSRAGIVWRVEILQQNDSEFEAVGDLIFEADEALVIEYLNTNKEDVVCGSTAKLQIESPGDRTYEDLYTIEPGRIRMDVYRNNLLYWSGTLDPEFYEEPYERLAHYVVSLTFSDFGILDRLKYNLSGMLTLSQIISHCISRAYINNGGIDESLISTSLTPGGAAMSLNSLTVRSDNFYDEDGKALSLKKVVEGVLQPLGLRMVQRCGKVWVYDLNGLYTKAGTAAAVWDGDSQTMGVDVVYNNAKITWSTYAQSGNLLPKDVWVKKTDANLTNINNLTARTYEGSDYFSYFYSNDLWGWADATDVGFTVWLNHDGKNIILPDNDLGRAANFFKIVPQYDGSESEGVALLIPRVRGYKVGTSSNWQAQIRHEWNGINPARMAGTLNDIDKAVFKTLPVWVPPVDRANDLLVKVTLELLMDPRFNPFEEGANFQKWLEQKDWQNEWRSRGNYLFIPVTVKFKPSGSDTIYIWDNRAIVSLDVNSSPVYTLSQTLGAWERFSNGNDDRPDHWGYVAWYDPKDRAENSGVAQGWAKNRPTINPHTKKIASILANAGDGQYIPYPNFGGKGGEIWVEVRGDGWQISDGGVNLSSTEIKNPHNLWGEEFRKKINWILFKAPEIEIVNNVQFEQAINTDDVEYKAEINANAKEAIELETICGTSAEGVPTARGAYFNTATGAQIKTLSRAGRTTQAEELLIGTLYSQYAERRTKLSGEMELHPDGMVAYTEQNQEGKKFIILHETQDVIMDVTDAEIVELRPDEYSKR